MTKLRLCHTTYLLCYRAALTHYGGRCDAVCRVDHSSPVGIRGALTAGVLWLLEERISIRDAEIFAVGKIAESPRFSGEEDASLQTAFPFHIPDEGRDIINRRIVDIMLELAEA